MVGCYSTVLFIVCKGHLAFVGIVFSSCALITEAVGELFQLHKLMNKALSNVCE